MTLNRILQVTFLIGADEDHSMEISYLNITATNELLLVKCVLIYSLPFFELRGDSYCWISVYSF